MKVSHDSAAPGRADQHIMTRITGIMMVPRWPWSHHGIMIVVLVTTTSTTPPPGRAGAYRCSKISMITAGISVTSATVTMHRRMKPGQRLRLGVPAAGR